MGETLAIALLGYVDPAVLALPLGLPLPRTDTTPSLLFRFARRRVLDVIRDIYMLIWALVFVGVVGLGPFAGILAVAVADTGALGNLSSEVIEAAPARERETVIACGGSGWMAIRFGLVPLVLPVIAGQLCIFLKTNMLSATIIGIVGAGGIGAGAFRADPDLRFRSGRFHRAVDPRGGGDDRLHFR